MKHMILITFLAAAGAMGLSAKADQLVHGQYVPVENVKGTPSACFSIPVGSEDVFLNVGPGLGEQQFLATGYKGYDGRISYSRHSYYPIGRTVGERGFRGKYSKALIEYARAGTELYFLETSSVNGQALSRGQDLSGEHVIFHTVLTLIDEDTLRVVAHKGRSAADRSFECILKRIR